VDAAVWTAIGLLAATSLGSLLYLGSRIDALGFALGSRVDGLGSRIDGLSSGIDSRIDGLSSTIDAQAARLDARIDAQGTDLGRRLDRLEANMSALTTVVNTLATGLNAHRERHAG
jgi:outer membrane murein-binding lipoprotein Lpp